MRGERSVGSTHTIVRLQTRIRRKDHGTEKFGEFVYVLDGFPQQRDFALWVFMCPINISLFCISFVSSSFSFPATTPRATTPHLYCTGYHAQGYHAFTTTARLPLLCMYIYSGYHPMVRSFIPRLSHLSYHAPPHT